jgi:hypothetical protein
MNNSQKAERYNQLVMEADRVHHQISALKSDILNADSEPNKAKLKVLLDKLRKIEIESQQLGAY